MVTPPNARGKREHSEGRQENFVSQRLQRYVVRFFNFSKNGLHWLQKLHIFQFLWQTHDNAYCDFYFKNFDYPEKPLKYKHIRRISD